MAKAAVLFGLSWLASYVSAKDVHLSWNITWVSAAPNGHQRPVIGINDQWPCPQVDVDLGDRLIVDVYNGLGNQTTGIHWHGFHQYMTGTMDGASDATQCSIPPGSEMTYDFTTNQTGTYWYHSHNMGQYPDGLRGPMVVHDPSPPFEYDAEFTLTLSDWYNEQMPTLLEYYESLENQESNGGHEPIPNAALINDASDTKIQVEPNKVYLVRFVCLGNWPGHTFVFDDHTMTVVEVDGVYTEPYEATGKKLRMATGQRMSVLIHTKPDASRNYAFWNTIDVNMMFFYENRSIPPNFNPNVTAWLVYDGNKELPPAPDIHKLDPNADFIDDVAFVPYEKEELLEPVDKQIVLHTASQKVNGIDRYTVNGKTYIPQNVPSLYTALSASNSSDPEVYGQVNPIIVHHNEVVEIVLNNHHNNLHPWHLHGHQFQVLQRSAVDGGSFHGYFQNISSTPIRRDTIMVQNHGHTVIRFRADNPGVWLLHCHIEWHVEKGLLATLIEAPEVMNMSIPDDHRSVCSSYGAPTSGNAAGNTGDNLSGAPTNIAPGDSGAMWNPQADDDSSTSTTTSSSTLAGSPTKQPTVPQNTPSPAPTTTSQPQPTPPSNDPPPAAYTVDPYGDDALALYNNDDYVWVEQRHKMRLSPVATPSPSASASHSHE